ncbi:unnamed protein product [Arctogadus glacialis]
MKQTLDVSALAPLPVQATLTFFRLEEAQRQRLQSTVLTEKAGVLQIPEDSPALSEARARTPALNNTIRSNNTLSHIILSDPTIVKSTLIKPTHHHFTLQILRTILQ